MLSVSVASAQGQPGQEAPAGLRWVFTPGPAVPAPHRGASLARARRMVEPGKRLDSGHRETPVTTGP